MTVGYLPKSSSWNCQKLAAEQLLPGQAVWSVRKDGTDRPSHNRSIKKVCKATLLPCRAGPALQSFQSLALQRKGLILYRIPEFLCSCLNWAPTPPPPPQSECVFPPFGSQGGRHTRQQGQGVGGNQGETNQMTRQKLWNSILYNPFTSYRF